MKPKIKLFISLLILFLLAPAVSATQITNIAPTPHTTYHKGDSYTTVYSPSQITPPNRTEPPEITLISPINHTLISTNNFTVTFDLTLEGSHLITLQNLTYKTSWQSDNVPIDSDSQKKYNNETLTFSISLSNVPEGEQSIAINADTMSEFETGRESLVEPISGMPGIPPYGNYFYIYSNYYFFSGLSSVDFVINTSPTMTPSPTSGNSTPNLEVEAIWAAAVVLLVLVILFFSCFLEGIEKTVNLNRLNFSHSKVFH